MDEDDTEYWATREKPPIYIVAAANRFGGVIIVGARHWDQRMRQQASMMGGVKLLRSFGDEEQGFIDQFGDWHSREDAMRICHRSGQPVNEERNGGVSVLFSEGLY